ncbi:SpoIIE family protein phosphatase [Konateibacter massiliensis]|uniref:SpoIIE family protein phosphatase n=1 Tax=Konateibacter massiliensis TaxID=2002841 RepID=UPI000C15CBB9|nr:SpoIIE family protein phosphatase [Konateibacter massiliensis]
MKLNVADEAVFLNGEINREKLVLLAKAFDELAASFSGLPKSQDKLSENELNHIFECLGEKYCKECEKCECCWEQNYFSTYQSAYEILSRINEDEEEGLKELKNGFAKDCIRTEEIVRETQRLFHRERENLKWNNKIISAREAVSEQLKAMSQIIMQIKDEVCLVEKPSDAMEKNIRFVLWSSRILAKNIFVINRADKRKELRITVKTKNGRCIPTKELANLIGSVSDTGYTVSKNCKNLINGEWYPVTLVEDVNFNMLYGVARRIKDGERVSGDNFSIIENKDGRSILCLADGMGSGLNACSESEKVIELLEELTEAGFYKEAAIKMINSLLVVKMDEPLFTTADLCEINLYSGLCEFVKAGAAISFIKRKNWVEVVEASTLPAGLVYEMETSTVSKKLYDGDFVVMMTDGVIDAFAPASGEEMLKDIIEEIDSTNPREIASEILEHVLEYNNGGAGDDMTILVAGIWGR